ncbi:hypothetical protein [Streptomyces sp. RB17]|uniref:hypothetical protein n=1 Tax=Streptomyces sp. RB17 TaxID=2585197 RepID=UPI00129723BF|nr:hypothetical protein [Streptomyces sp. RB17]
MGSPLGRGGVAGCLWNGCLAVLVLALLVVSGVWLWLWLAPRHWEHEARDQMEKQAAETRARLADSAADGVLLGTEIDRDVHPGPMAARAQVRRHGGTVTVTALLAGLGPGFMGPTQTTGCYRFRVVAHRVTTAHVPDEACGGRTPTAYRPPAEVADDVITEARAALDEGGLDAVRVAAVWRTPGIDVVRMEFPTGQLIVTARLRHDVGVSLATYCYSFRVRQHPPSVAARNLAPSRCG